MQQKPSLVVLSFAKPKKHATGLACRCLFTVGFSGSPSRLPLTCLPSVCVSGPLHCVLRSCSSSVRLQNPPTALAIGECSVWPGASAPHVPSAEAAIGPPGFTVPPRSPGVPKGGSMPLPPTSGPPLTRAEFRFRRTRKTLAAT